MNAPTHTTGNPPLLQVSGLGKSFGGVKAVDGIDFTLQPGELLALIGPNGAGKSTTFNMVNGQLKADQGSILFDGHELVGQKPRSIWRSGSSPKRTWKSVTATSPRPASASAVVNR